MNKKLLAVAVACALAAPGVALAQMSSVTISGILKVGVDNLNISNPAAARAGKNTSEMRVTDNSSRILLNMTEDLGNGLAAVGQVDIRFSTDIGSNAYASSPTNVGATTMGASGNTWVGIQSKSMGRIFFGRSDLHYGSQPDDIATKAGALMASSVGLFDYIGGTAIAGGTRTNNVVRYDSPNWGGFEVTLAGSTNPTNVESDLQSTAVTRKGSAWNLKPRYTAGNWGAGWSHWDQKADGDSTPGALTSSPAVCTAAQTTAGGVNVGTGCLTNVTAASTPANQKSDTLYGYMTFGGLKVGLGFNKSKLINAATSAETNNRDAWTIPISYTFGPNNIYFHYTQAKDDKDTAATDGAKMWALAYVYELSKRTSVGLTLAQITNDSGAAYNFFTNGPGGANGVFGSVNSASLAGEKPRVVAMTVRHAF